MESAVYPHVSVINVEISESLWDVAGVVNENASRISSGGVRVASPLAL